MNRQCEPLACSVASMGPRLHSRGYIWGSRTLSRVIFCASMGPRLHSRGYQIANSPPCRAETASMGPRLHSRGYVILIAVSPAAVKSFNGAPASQPRIPLESVHGSGQSDGFNGAEASQPRILGIMARIRRVKLASMGPRLHSRGYPRGHG